MEGERHSDVIEELRKLFGSYKAEWLGGSIFEHFCEPAYFPELKGPRPCVLIGGRGTGKTTTLRCLSYEGRFALADERMASILEDEIVGLYYRVNTNRVTAFEGPELSASEWDRLFAHYINLEFCDLLLEFVDWLDKCRESSLMVESSLVEEVELSLNLETSGKLGELKTNLGRSRIEFEAAVNNVADSESRPPLSMQEAPVRALVKALRSTKELSGTTFAFLLDEYENYSRRQQRVVNTLVKHASGEYTGYTFKIGVRELGFKERTTLRDDEQLVSPADYALINIVDSLRGRFGEFGAAVCNDRLGQIEAAEVDGCVEVREVLGALSEEEEANLLGVGREAERIRGGFSGRLREFVEGLSDLEVYFMEYWAEGRKDSLEDVVAGAFNEQQKWRERFSNYKHACLYTIRSGKRGIRKHYAGWGTYVQLAAANIRYLLELVHRALQDHIEGEGEFGSTVAPKTQTRAAEAIGRKNLNELEGLSVHGARLTKLLLSLGRIFQVMAYQAAGHAPEVNQFTVKGEATEEGDGDDLEGRSGQAIEEQAEDLLTGAVMHLALLRFPGSKLQDRSETRGYDYMPHPIFAPFFVFSWRRKRKMKLSTRELLMLVERPRVGIRRVLESQNRRIEDAELPEQLRLFGGFYGEKGGKEAAGSE